MRGKKRSYHAIFPVKKKEKNSQKRMQKQKKSYHHIHYHRKERRRRREKGAYKSSNKKERRRKKEGREVIDLTETFFLPNKDREGKRKRGGGGRRFVFSSHGGKEKGEESVIPYFTHFACGSVGRKRGGGNEGEDDFPERGLWAQGSEGVFLIFLSDEEGWRGREDPSLLYLFQTGRGKGRLTSFLTRSEGKKEGDGRGNTLLHLSKEKERYNGV